MINRMLDLSTFGFSYFSSNSCKIRKPEFMRFSCVSSNICNNYKLTNDTSLIHEGFRKSELRHFIILTIIYNKTKC